MERDGAELIPWNYIIGTNERFVEAKKNGSFVDNGKPVDFKRGSQIFCREDPYNEMLRVWKDCVYLIIFDFERRPVLAPR